MIKTPLMLAKALYKGSVSPINKVENMLLITTYFYASTG